MAKKRATKSNDDFFVMLKEDWPGSRFRRSVRDSDGKPIRVLRFAPGEPVKLNQQEFAAVENDIGVALLRVNKATPSRPRPKTPKASEPAPKLQKAVAPRVNTDRPKGWKHHGESIQAPLDESCWFEVRPKTENGVPTFHHKRFEDLEKLKTEIPVRDTGELCGARAGWLAKFIAIRRDIEIARDQRLDEMAVEWAVNLLQQTRDELWNVGRAVHAFPDGAGHPQINDKPADLDDAQKQLESLVEQFRRAIIPAGDRKPPPPDPQEHESELAKYQNVLSPLGRKILKVLWSSRFAVAYDTLRESVDKWKDSGILDSSITTELKRIRKRWSKAKLDDIDLTISEADATVTLHKPAPR